MACAWPVRERERGDMTRLLIDDYPVLVSRRLGRIFGLHEAILVQQIHYWVELFKQAQDMRHFQDGFWWVWNSTRQWKEDNFPWWSEDTIDRVIERLAADFQPHESKGDQRMPRGPLLVIGNYNQAAYDRTRWYRLDYREIDRVIDLFEQQEAERIRQERLAERQEREPLFAATGVAGSEGEDFSDLFAKSDRSTEPQEPGFLERARELGATDPLALGALVQEKTEGRPSWTVPANAGGASAYGDVYLTFCAITRRPPDQLTVQQQVNWLRQFEKLALEYRLSPTVMAETVRRLRDTHAWYLEHDQWATPWAKSFVDAVSLVGARVATGEFEGQDEQSERTRGKEQGQVGAIGLAGRIT